MAHITWETKDHVQTHQIYSEPASQLLPIKGPGYLEQGFGGALSNVAYAIMRRNKY